ncbi:PaaX family transcriptional regulator [Gemmobacter lanyuensis]|uniref:PaaX family transcriptional regulator n=1 Tax=Gemmobacter lanyuensis TaxID=1054497 RepID=A0A918J182_9RHOB|nr:PaaX family transcriptional regulator C-terminal domain-containing protein [Gemmobacter lanyuensis]GGW42107.1 PaaX family transcriptional regulator [Gemmobacter lanyuensis]
MPRTALTDRLMQDLPLTAASFIVTVYGDIVVPRGEVLWMGSLIEICDNVGISENLVRTAVSRLVSAGSLLGERNGRRSFYRLAPAARAEFAEAAQRLFARQTEPDHWFILHAPDLGEETAKRFRMARMGGDVWLCPDRGDRPTGASLVLRTQAEDAVALQKIAAFWDLTSVQGRYEAMLARFSPLHEALLVGETLAPADALTARLLLVQVYRSALLRDPGLPAAALPDRWQGAAARRLFDDLYARLSPLADAEVARKLEGSDGPLPAETPETINRINNLA